VACHRDRLACDLGVALTHVHGDVLVHTGDDFRLVVSVIENGFVQAAIARRAVDGEVLDAERIEHVGHEVTAAGRLIDGVAARRHGFARDLPRAGNGGLQLRRRRRRQRVGDRRRDRSGCADQASALQEIATGSIRRRALRHGVLPQMAALIWRRTIDICCTPQTNCIRRDC
jgi:hypothetical protein